MSVAHADRDSTEIFACCPWHKQHSHGSQAKICDVIQASFSAVAFGNAYFAETSHEPIKSFQKSRHRGHTAESWGMLAALLCTIFDMGRPAVTPTRWTTRTATVCGRPSRILVVDDHRSAADALATYLELLSLSVQAAYDGTSAIALTKIWRPDVVLLDISMPGLDGFEVAKALRADLQVASVIIVALTAHDEAHVRTRATSAEFDGYCQKGLVLDPLMRLLEELTRDEPQQRTTSTEFPTVLPGDCMSS